MTDQPAGSAIRENNDWSEKALRQVLESAVYTGIVGSTRAVTQLVDKVTPFKLDEKLASGFDALGFTQPQPAEFGTLEWHAQQLGNAFGFLATYTPIHRFLRRGMSSLASDAEMLASMSLRDMNGMVVREAVLSALGGGIHGMIFTPESDLGKRANSALASGFTFGVLGASSVYIGRAGAGLQMGSGNAALAMRPVTYHAGELLQNPVVGGILSAVPAGLVSYTLEPERQERWNAQEAAKAIYGFAFVGAAFGLARINDQKPQTIIEIKNRDGDRVFRGHEYALAEFLEKSNAEGVSFAGWNLSNRYLGGINLQGAHLEGALLDASDFHNTNLAFAHLQSASLQRAQLDHTDFRNARMEDANLKHATIVNSNFSQAHMPGSNLTSSIISHSIFDRANLVKAEMLTAKIDSSSWQEANLQQAKLADANIATSNFSEANLRSADLSGGRFFDTHFHRADLKNVDAKSADFGFSAFAKTDLTHMNVKGASFDFAAIHDTRLDLNFFADSKYEHAQIDKGSLSPQVRMHAEVWKKAPTLPTNLVPAVHSLGEANWFRAGVAWERARLGLVPGMDYYSGFRHEFRALEGERNISLVNKLIEAQKDHLYLSYQPKVQHLSPAVEALYGKFLSAKQQAMLANELAAVSMPHQFITSIKPKVFAEVEKTIGPYLRTGQPKLHETGHAATALRVTQHFGAEWKKWLNPPDGKFDYQYVHDRTYWLPEIHETTPSLGKFLLQNKNRPIPALEMISRRWRDLTEEQRQLSYSELLDTIRSTTYPQSKNKQFATEAALWGVEPSDYSNLEARYIASLNVPSPFPLERSWSHSGLTGRFLRRDDPRGVFLGQHTACCQHPFGEAASSTWYGQTSPKSGFFVVENKHGYIVAQSWVWISDQGRIVFDNVEAKGIGENRMPDVRRIYEQAAQDLRQEHGTVFVGATGKLDLQGLRNARLRRQRLPSGYDGYTDAHTQMILAP